MDHSGTIEIDYPSDDSDQLLPNDNTSFTSSSETLRAESLWNVFIKHWTNIKAVRRLKYFRKRLINSKPVIVILIIYLLHSFCFHVTTISTYQMISDHNDNSTYTPTIFILLQAGGISAFFNPIGGILGDVFFGRHILPVLCLFTSFLVSVIHAVLLSLWNSSTIDTKDYWQTFYFTSLFFILTVSDGFFALNWLTFGADQLINSPSDEVSSYMYWWYWVRNVGLVLALVTHTGLSVMSHYLWDDHNFIKSNEVMICVVCTALSATIYFIALLTDLAASPMYDRKRVLSNPIKLIIGVFKNAYTSRPKLIVNQSAFRYGEDPPSGLDHALVYHGGKYTEEEVESVRSCLRIGLMIFVIAMNGFFAIYFAVSHQLQTSYTYTLLHIKIALRFRIYTVYT